MLAAFSVLGDQFVATTSSNARALDAEDLGMLARPYYENVEVVEDPVHALAFARRTAGPEGAVLVTGSLYLLADLASVRSGRLPWREASASG
jgi:folylpolyglutamate synthase/dihydropteroate synthase